MRRFFAIIMNLPIPRIRISTPMAMGAGLAVDCSLPSTFHHVSFLSKLVRFFSERRWTYVFRVSWLLTVFDCMPQCLSVLPSSDRGCCERSVGISNVKFRGFVAPGEKIYVSAALAMEGGISLFATECLDGSACSLDLAAIEYVWNNLAPQQCTGFRDFVFDYRCQAKWFAFQQYSLCKLAFQYLRQHALMPWSTL